MVGRKSHFVAVVLVTEVLVAFSGKFLPHPPSSQT
jgi:hypothetical protein